MFEKSLITEAEQIENILLKADYIEWEKLKNKTVFVTGGTGLVGSAFIKLLLAADSKFSLGIKILALVRNKDKGEALFGNKVAFIVGDLEHLPEIKEEINYIMHAASPTTSKYFVDMPVETIKTAVGGTIKLLDLASIKRVEGFVYLSSMEVYGENHTDDILDESAPSKMTSLSVRNCYPQSKLICENLCVSYAHEYGLPCKIVRLAQTFGPGVPMNDNRVFAQFARSVINGNDIVLQTAGETKRCYLYTLDSATAILTVMLKGEAGNAFNAANPETYCSVYEMAKLVANKVAGGKIAVQVNAGGGAQPSQYLPPHKWNLGVDKLRSLGWSPTFNLEEMYENLIFGMQKDYES